MAEGLNGAQPHPMHPQIDPMAAAVVRLLEDTLRQARGGAFHSIAIVACGRAGFGHAFAGPDLGSINFGLDGAKRALLDSVTQANTSRIIRPAR